MSPIVLIILHHATSVQLISVGWESCRDLIGYVPSLRSRFQQHLNSQQISDGFLKEIVPPVVHLGCQGLRLLKETRVKSRVAVNMVLLHIKISMSEICGQHVSLDSIVPVQF